MTELFLVIEFAFVHFLVILNAFYYTQLKCSI